MKAGCRRCDRAYVLCVYSLVSRFIVPVVIPLDIRRKRHLAETFENLEEDALIKETDVSNPFVVYPGANSLKTAVSENEQQRIIEDYKQRINYRQAVDQQLDSLSAEEKAQIE